MRLLALLVYIGIIVVVAIILYSVIGFTGYMYYSSVKDTVRNVSEEMNVSVDVNKTDIIPGLKPVFVILNVVLILVFIVAIVAVFIHSRRR